MGAEKGPEREKLGLQNARPYEYALFEEKSIATTILITTKITDDGMNRSRP